MPMVDLAFKLMGTRIPVDHGYALYAAINRLVPELHDAKDIGVHPLRGRFDVLLALRCKVTARRANGLVSMRSSRSCDVRLQRRFRDR
jgi:hypothetical protein